MANINSIAQSERPSHFGKIVEIVHNEPRVTSLVISENMGLTHQTVLKNIDTYKTELESLGLVGFEIRPRPEGQHGGGDTRYALLNEQQATFLVTLSRNTEKVVQFKLALTKAFFEARNELAKQKNAASTTLIIPNFEDPVAAARAWATDTSGKTPTVSLTLRPFARNSM